MATADRQGMQRHTIFLVQVLWVLTLGVLAWLYFNTSLFKGGPPVPIPLGVIWFGALGAVLLSLNGVIDHAHDWDPSFDLWHLSRPIMGAALASVGSLMVQAGILAVGSGANAPAAPSQNLLYYLIAFLIGYREETFRELTKRLVDLVFAPATPKPVPSISKVEPPQATLSGKRQVAIIGTGLLGATSVMFGSRAADFQVDSDYRVKAELPADVAGPVTLVVKTTGGSSQPFEYTA